VSIAIVEALVIPFLITSPADEEARVALEAGAVESRGRFHLYRDRAEKWRWRLVHHNGYHHGHEWGGVLPAPERREGNAERDKNAAETEPLMDD
jgi:hypothetical protein